MLYFLTAPTRPKPWQMAPQRRRVIVVGAGRTGLSAAYHLGEHGLLLEQRSELRDATDTPATELTGVSRAERRALFISCSSTSQPRTDAPTVIRIARWEPPGLAPPEDAHRETASPRALLPLLRGEVRFGAQVVRISPAEHLLELADGGRFTYDKLMCTQSLPAVVSLLLHELPAHVRRDEALRYWLSDHDVEPADRVTQVCHGDIDELAAGKRIADVIGRALAVRFQRHSSNFPRDRLFEPRVVRSANAPATL